MQIDISTRHGSLEAGQLQHIREKAEKLVKYFNRVMSIQVAVEPIKHNWQVEILISAEHKHDFVAVMEAPSPSAAMDLCSHKIEEQLRRYKDRVQNHKGEVPAGGASPANPDLPAPPESA